MIRKVFKLIFILLVLVGVYNIIKPLPDGVSVEGKIHSVSESQVVFLNDKTFIGGEGVRQTDQEIFDEVFRMIDEAEQYILIDMFLFNNFQGKVAENTRDIFGELVEVLYEKKINNPDINIVFITDPINRVYGGDVSEEQRLLQDNGIQVIETNLGVLRDSNPIYSAVWRSIIQFLPLDSIKFGHIFDSSRRKIGMSSYMELFNFKANHRKLILTDYINSDGRQDMSVLVTSANPHNGSSAHGNVALRINGDIWKDVYMAEQAVAAMSEVDIFEVVQEGSDNEMASVLVNDLLQVQFLTEGEIRKSVIRSIENTQSGDIINMAMFYIADRGVVKALKDAYDEGVKLRLIFDPSKDAFGRTKNGLPNVAVAKELRDITNGLEDENFELKWCDTHGEQCHAKLILIQRGDYKEAFVGSANLTKRNLKDYNLEANIKVMSDNPESALMRDISEYFEDLWWNEGGEYTTEYSTYADESVFKYWQYRFMEFTGMSTF